MKIYLKLIFFFKNKQAPLVQGGEILDKWSNPAEDSELKLTIYLFNVTNPGAIKSGKEKPRGKLFC